MSTHTNTEYVEPATGATDDDESLEPDASAEDDSALGSDIESTASGSLTSSIVGYKYENGRRYHAYREGSYLLPNDDREQARLDLSHHIYSLILDGALYRAPLQMDGIKRALDFGTVGLGSKMLANGLIPKSIGTGIWAIDFADELPNCEVIGTDLSPIQPTSVPPNLRFYVDDVEADWGYREDEAFDFIHGRGMGGSIVDWNRLFRQIYDNLKPGGWVEMQEYAAWLYSKADPTLSQCPNVKKWLDLVNEASATFGREIDMAWKQKDLLESAGFINVQQHAHQVPLGRWAKGQKAKELGICKQEVVLEGVDAFTISLFTRVLGWSTDECEVLMAHCRRELRDPKNQLYGLWYFAYGQKPT